MLAIKVVLIAVVSYLIGNIQSGIFVARAFGLEDIRKVGSGGTGTTNVLRNLGFAPSAIVFVSDMLKGVLGVLLGRWLLGDVGAAIGGVFAIIGHNWPVLFGFKGGKGVATSLGSLIAISPVLGLVVMVSAIVLIALIRIVSIVSILGTLIAVIFLVALNPGNWAYLIFGVCAFIMVVYSHRENIQRLKNGTERRLDFKAIKEKGKKKS